MDNDLAQIEDILRRHNAGNFIKTVNGSIDKADGRILMTLRAFYREPELLYTALAYASAKGAAVTFAPETKKADVTFHREAAGRQQP